jgi:hypothetical protein
MLGQFGYEDECIKVYDPVKKECIAVYDNYFKAEKALGLTAKVLRGAARSKTRRFSPFLNKEIAIRVAAKEKNEKKT